MFEGINPFDKKPLVTIITPTYKREDQLYSAIMSVANQTFTDFEHLTISDGWFDDEYFWQEIRQNLSKTNPDIFNRFFFCSLPWNHKDVGSTPKNVGLMLAKGKYVAYLDDDNEYLPRHIETLVNLIEEKNVDFVFSSTLLRNQSDPTTDIGTRVANAPAYGHIDTSEILHKKEVPFKFGFWRNSDFTDIHPWGKPTGFYGTDWDLISRWLNAGATWAHSNEITLIYYYRR